MTRRRRLDTELVRRGLVASRGDALAVIDAQRVLVNGAPALKPARLVDPADNLAVEGRAARYVSRGGEKLEAALVGFALEVSGCRALDAGASTGGFTDCLLQHGASAVVALDVGHGQLHPRIRDDERVHVIERFNARHLTVDDIGGPVDTVVADLSFISLSLVVPNLVGVCRSGGILVLLVKPQFEAGRREVSRGRGVITDPEVHEQACASVAAALEAAGAQVRAWMPSPLLGGEGNREFLVYAEVPGVRAQ